MALSATLRFIGKSEERAFREAAAHVLSLNGKQLPELIDRGGYVASIHETMTALHEIGAVHKRTMRPKKIRRICEREQVSQSVFANYLNVTPGLVSKWERGEKRPSGASLKLLTLVKDRGLQSVA